MRWFTLAGKSNSNASNSMKLTGEIDASRLKVAQ